MTQPLYTIGASGRHDDDFIAMLKVRGSTP